MGAFARAKRMLPHAAVTGLHKRAELEPRTGRVLGLQADIRFDDCHFALVDHQHRHHLDRDQERVERVGAVEQRVVLKPDATAGVHERLVVLIVVVQLVLAPEESLDHLQVVGALRLHRLEVLESAQPSGDVPGRQRLPLVDGHDPDHVAHGSALRTRPRLDADEIQLLGAETKHLGRELAALLALRFDLWRDGHAVHFAFRDHEEADRVNRHERARGQHGSLHAFLSALLDEGPEVREVAELLLVDGRLGTNGQRLSDLRDDHADLTGRHLNPGTPLDRVDRPQQPTQARHEKVRLVSSLALKRHGVVVLQRAGGIPFAHQTYLARSDAPERCGHHKEHGREHHEHEERR